ncbi:MAG: ion transporter [Myxococcota bacterium]
MDSERSAEAATGGWRSRLHEVIFEADTTAGKRFDVALLIAIVVSIVAVMLESVPAVAARRSWAVGLRLVEWVLTLAFTIEYVLRLAAVRRPGSYATSFFGVIDLLAILPTYLSLLIPGSQAFIVVRGLRLLRAFRVLKLLHLLVEARSLRRAVVATWPKISVFLMTVVILITIVGSAMYVIEGPESGFTSVPKSMYWAVVTLTTVGYGDIVPQSAVGKGLAALMMICGYALIVVPTGVLSAELVRPSTAPISTQSCPACSSEGHAPGAKFCSDCGHAL